MKVKIILSIISLTMIFGVFGQNNSMIDSLENVLKTAKADTVKVNILNALSSQYQFISDFEIAIHYGDSALVLADKINYKKGKANAYHNLALDYIGQSNYPESLKYHNMALKTREEIGDKKGMASSYGNIGSVYLEQGNYPQAFKYFFSSLDLMEEIKDKDGVADVYYKIGMIYYTQGTYAESMINFLTSLKIYDEIGHKRGIANSYNSIGNIYKEQANYADAMKYYQVSLKMRDEIGDKRGVVFTNMNIGIVHQKQGNHSEALKIYLAGLIILEEIGDKGSISKAYCIIGQIYYSLENYSQALRNFQIALKISEDIDNYPLSAWIKINLGQLNIKLNNYQDARKYLTDALPILKKQYGNIDIKDCYRYLCEIDIAEGDFENALKNYKMYIALKDSLFNEKSNNKLTQLQIQFETEKKDREIELLNKDNELQEHQLEKQRLIRNGMITGAVLLLLVGILLFRSFRLRKKLEKQQAIIQERKRISADLHDDVGSGLSRIMLLSELVKKEAKTPKTRKEAEKIAAISHELSSNISEIIWAMNSNNDYVENLVAYIRRYAAEYFEYSSVKLKINTPVKMNHTHICGEHRQNIFYAVKEALHNVIKHAQATETKLKFTVKHDVLSVVIQDNGKGFPEEELNRFGNGFNNMRNRMKSINGNCIIENHKGTRISLTLPV